MQTALFALAENSRIQQIFCLFIREKFTKLTFNFKTLTLTEKRRYATI